MDNSTDENKLEKLDLSATNTEENLADSLHSNFDGNLNGEVASENDGIKSDDSSQPETLSEQLSAVTSKKDNNSKFFICGICNLNAVAGGTSPKLLPCLHSFCEKCLQQKYDQQKDATTDNTDGSSLNPRLKCPSCGQEFLVSSNGVTGFLNNQFIIEASTGVEREIEQLGQKVCTSCEDESAAHSFCSQCREWLCDTCVQAHQRVKVTRDHIIKSTEEYENDSDLKEPNKPATSPDQKPLFCKMHPHEQLRLFCATCDKLTCRDCQLVEHKDHRYQFIDEAASKHREVMKKLLQYLKVNLGLLNDTVKDVENVATRLEEKEKELEKDIMKSFESVIKSLKHRERVLIAELQGLVQNKLGLLAKQKKDLTQMSTILEHNHDFASYAIENGSDVALLYCRKVLGTRLHNLNSLKYRQRPLAFNDLRFALDVDKMCGYIAKIGTVYSQEDLQRRMEQYGIASKSTNSSSATTAASSHTTASQGSNLAQVVRDLRPGSNQGTVKHVAVVSSSNKVIPNKLNPIEAMSAVNKRISDSAATSNAPTQYIALSSPGIPHYVPKHSRPASNGHYSGTNQIVLSHVTSNHQPHEPTSASKKNEFVFHPSKFMGSNSVSRKDFSDLTAQQSRSTKPNSFTSVPLNLPSCISATLANMQNIGNDRKKSPHDSFSSQKRSPTSISQLIKKVQTDSEKQILQSKSIILDSGYAALSQIRRSPDESQPRSKSSGSESSSSGSAPQHAANGDMQIVKQEKLDSPPYQHCMQSFAVKTNGSFLLMVSFKFLGFHFLCFFLIYLQIVWNIWLLEQM